MAADDPRPFCPARRRRRRLSLSRTAGLLLGAGLAFLISAEARSFEPIPVTVSILPQKYFVDRIGGERVNTSVMVLPGASPAVYEPKPQQMVHLTASRIYFAVGVPFENAWLEKFASANPQMDIISTQDSVRRLPMKGLHLPASSRQDGEHGSVREGREDPHIWLSPPLVMLQSRAVLKALLRADPEGSNRYYRNYRRFIEDLVKLDLEIDRILAQARGSKFMVYHPSWGYFARAYDLIQIPVQAEGKPPSPKALETLIRYARDHDIRAVFVQPQFSGSGAKTIADAVGGAVVTADPLAADWRENLRQVAEKFSRVLR